MHQRLLRSVAAQAGVVHVDQVLVPLRRAGHVAHAGGRDAGAQGGRQGRLDGGGGDGAVVQRGQVFHVEGGHAVVQLGQLHGVEAETDGPGEELLGVHHVCGERRRERESSDATADAISFFVDATRPWRRRKQWWGRNSTQRLRPRQWQRGDKIEEADGGKKILYPSSVWGHLLIKTPNSAKTSFML